MSIYADRVFPWLLDRVSPRFDSDRARLLVRARGRVLELGVGTGASLGFYPEAVTEVVGIEPHAASLDRARHVAATMDRPYRITLEAGDAQALPYGDATFDTVVAFLTLCSIPDPLAAAREALRVLKPDGRLLVMEHVAAAAGSRLQRWQRRLDPLWRRAAQGCHLDRPTGEILERAGFDVSGLDSYRADTRFPLTAPRIRGVVGRGRRNFL